MSVELTTFVKKEFRIPDDEEANQILFDLDKAQSQIQKTYNIAKSWMIENRYIDILPYDQNLFLKIPNFYYNASPIFLLDKEYIAAQGPKNDQEIKFWQVILSSNARVIVTVTDVIEKGVSKTAPWWEVLPNGIQLLSQETILQCIDKREFWYEEKERIITHLHYRGWNDMTAPDQNVLSTLIENAKTPYPIIVHCSAGVGRTAVFIACHFLAMQLEKNIWSMDIPDLLLALRYFRPNMIRTASQVQAVFEFAKRLLDQKKTALQV